jgi:hypothetical protein
MARSLLASRLASRGRPVTHVLASIRYLRPGTGPVVVGVGVAVVVGVAVAVRRAGVRGRHERGHGCSLRRGSVRAGSLRTRARHWGRGCGHAGDGGRLLDTARPGTPLTGATSHRLQAVAVARTTLGPSAMTLPHRSDMEVPPGLCSTKCSSAGRQCPTKTVTIKTRRSINEVSS